MPWLMHPLVIEPKPKTPFISFNSETGSMEIKGMSCSENSFEFYKPVIDWVNKYAQKPVDETTVQMEFKYFNTSSAKCILDLLERFVAIKQEGHNVKFNWVYEPNDDQMIESGEYFSEMLAEPFNLIEGQ